MTLTVTPQADPLASLLSDITNAVGTTEDQWTWAEDEIVQVTRRHPHVADDLFHRFSLLQPTSHRMATQFVYRSHCRELLDRVANGNDTRPGTAAEVCLALLEVSLITP